MVYTFLDDWHHPTGGSHVYPPYVGGVTVLVSREHVPDSALETKKETRRPTVRLVEGRLEETGFAVGKLEHTKLSNCLRKREAVRFMRNWNRQSQIGWAYILYLRLEHFGETPATAPVLEGMPDFSREEFMALGCFAGVENDHVMLVIGFRFFKLGPPDDPFPPSPRAMVELWDADPPSPLESSGTGEEPETETESDSLADSSDTEILKREIEGGGSGGKGETSFSDLEEIPRSSPVYQSGRIPSTTTLFGKSDGSGAVVLEEGLWSVEGVKDNGKKRPYEARRDTVGRFQRAKPK